MKISVESDLMKNQKHAVVMAPDKKFSVLQSVEGDSLFFSIGDPGELYLTREGSHLRAGWEKISSCFSKPIASLRACIFCLTKSRRGSAGKR